MSRRRKGLGDIIETALSTLGITPEKVEAYLGKPCRCRERKRKLNQLSAWASRILSGKRENAEEELDKMIGDEK